MSKKSDSAKSKLLDQIPASELKAELESKLKITLPKDMPENQVVDLARNKLHDENHLFPDEEVRDGKIVKKPWTPKNQPRQDCPMCGKKNGMVVEPFPKESDLFGAKHCASCGFWIMPNKGGN